MAEALQRAFEISRSGFEQKLDSVLSSFQSLKKSQLRRQEAVRKLQRQKDLAEFESQLQLEKETQMLQRRTEAKQQVEQIEQAGETQRQRMETYVEARDKSDELQEQFVDKWGDLINMNIIRNVGFEAFPDETTGTFVPMAKVSTYDMERGEMVRMSPGELEEFAARHSNAVEAINKLQELRGEDKLADGNNSIKDEDQNILKVGSKGLSHYMTEFSKGNSFAIDNFLELANQGRIQPNFKEDQPQEDTEDISQNLGFGLAEFNQQVRGQAKAGGSVLQVETADEKFNVNIDSSIQDVQDKIEQVFDEVGAGDYPNFIKDPSSFTKEEKQSLLNKRKQLKESVIGFDGLETAYRFAMQTKRELSDNVIGTENTWDDFKWSRNWNPDQPVDNLVIPRDRQQDQPTFQNSVDDWWNSR